MPGDPQIGKRFNLITERRNLRKLCPDSADFLRHMASMDGWSPKCAERWIEAAEAMEALLEALQEMVFQHAPRDSKEYKTEARAKAAIAKAKGKEVGP